MACLKKPHPNQFAALRALEMIRTTGKPGKQPVRVYPCQDCSSWHLTSKRLTGKLPKWERRPSHHSVPSPWPRNLDGKSVRNS